MCICLYIHLYIYIYIYTQTRAPRLPQPGGHVNPWLEYTWFPQNMGANIGENIGENILPSKHWRKHRTLKTLHTTGFIESMFEFDCYARAMFTPTIFSRRPSDNGHDNYKCVYVYMCFYYY